MQDINSIGHTGRVYHPVCTIITAHPDFLNTLTDGWHGFEITWLTAPLYLVQLETNVLPDMIGKFADAVECITKKRNFLHEIVLYQNRYNWQFIPGYGIFMLCRTLGSLRSWGILCLE